MTTPNEALIEKTVQASTELATAGRLNAEQGEKFIDQVRDQSKWKDIARLVKVDTDWEIPKIAIGERVIVLANEAQDPRLRRTVTPSKLSLTPIEFMLPFELSDSFVEENIEGENIKTRLIELFARQLANNFELMAWTANKTGPAIKESDYIGSGDAAKYVHDKTFSQFDGWLKQLDSANVYDAAGANLGASVWSGAIQKLPEKFRVDQGNYKWGLSSNSMMLWLEGLSSRVGALGDNALNGSKQTTPFGVAPMDFPLLPFNPKYVQHVTLVDASTAAALSFKPILSGSEIVTAATLASEPVTPFVKDTDYTIDYSAGTVTKKGGGVIQDGTTVKVTYQANPQAILVAPSNLIVAMGKRDIRIEYDRDIYRRVHMYAITFKAVIGVQELTSCVKIKNLGMGA